MTVPPPPAAGAAVVAADELAAGLTLAADATNWLAAEADGDAGVVEASGDSMTVEVAAPAVAAAVVAEVFDFVAGFHAAEANATTPTTTMAVAVDSARTCMAAPCSDAARRAFPPHRS
ncbi:MAG TPA: hypothetical protein VIJ96_00615 [Acidothermaceae bacterium]